MRFIVAALSVALAACSFLPKADDPATMRAATVHIQIGDSGTCSGVVIAPETVLTAAHCVEGGKDVLHVGDKPVGAVRADPGKDIAVLRVAGVACPCVPVASQSPLRDTPVTIVGYPMNLAQILTEGRFMGRITDPDAPDEIKPRMVATAPVAFGNSGGPVFAYQDGKLRVVGIVSALRGSGPYTGPIWHLALLVSVETIREFLA